MSNVLVFSDFLNIPPPAQPPPPEESPCIDRPLPPQRTLPPLPDEPLYEEAKPAPPPTMPRPSKHQLLSQAKNGMMYFFFFFDTRLTIFRWEQVR